MPTFETIVNHIDDLRKSCTTVMRDPNNARICRLAEYSKKKRIRKKNIKRLVKMVLKDVKK